MFIDMLILVNVLDRSVTLDAVTCCAPLDAVSISDEEAQATATLFKALGDPARVRILNVIATAGEAVCACEFPQALGLSQSTVSHHLKKLVDSGLLDREQRGKWAFFTLNRDAAAKLALVADLNAACC
jgi:ArsR family transcriptional regulator